MARLTSLKSPRRSPGARAPLNRERVLRAAIRLADRHGIDSLSMRNLGQALGVEAMSLYNHVKNKEDLLDGMVDVVYGEIDLPGTGVDWRTAMRQRAVSVHQVLLRHPWALPLMESRSSPGPANLRHHNAVLGVLRNAGFSVEMAGHAYSVIDGYLYGFTLTDVALPVRNSQALAKVAGNILQAAGDNRYPHLAEMTLRYAANPGYNFGAEFEYGLDLILDAIQRLTDS